MHRADGEAAPQRRIRFHMPERHPVGVIGFAMLFDARDAAAQSRKRARAGAGHAPLLQGGWAVTGCLEANPRLAHLFMICSNIKLTSLEESIGYGVYDFRE